MDYGLVKISPLSYLQVIPEFIPPASEETSNEATSQLDNEATTEQSFGGTNNPATQTSNPQTLISLTGTSNAGLGTNTTSSTSNPSTGSGQGILWGFGAAALIGAATATALGQKKRREEEEAAQIAQVQAEVDAKNASIEANRIAMMEQLKIRNWLEGQAVLNAQIEQLESQGATAEQIAALREQGASQGLGVAHQNAGNLSQYLAQQAALAQQAQQSTHNHLMNEHQNVISNIGGGKPWFSLVNLPTGNDVIDSGGDEDYGYEIRDNGLIIIWHNGTIQAYDTSVGVDQQTQQLLDAYIRNSEMRVEQLQDFNTAQSDFIWTGGAAFAIAIGTAIGYITAPVGFGVPIAVVGTTASAYAAYEVYQAGMQWGQSSTALGNTESNLENSWDALIDN